jgi:aminoacrylate hydrolase
LTKLDREIVIGKIDALLAFDRRECLPLIRCPTLVLGARDDVTVPSYFSVALVQAVSVARLSILDCGGHYFPITRAHEFGTIVHDFLTNSTVRTSQP